MPGGGGHRHLPYRVALSAAQRAELQVDQVVVSAQGAYSDANQPVIPIHSSR